MDQALKAISSLTVTAKQNLQEWDTQSLHEEKVDRTAANTYVTQRIEGSVVTDGVRYTLTNIT